MRAEEWVRKPGRIESSPNSEVHHFLSFVRMHNETSLSHDGNMQKPGTDIDKPASQEQVVDNGQESPAKDPFEAAKTEGESADPGKLDLRVFLETMEKDDEDASGNVTRLREILRRSRKTYVNTEFPGDSTPLHIAAERGLEKVAKVLIEIGANVSPRDIDSRQPLHCSCENGKRSIAELLIKNGAELNAQDCWKETPLHKACRYGYTDLVELLLESDAKMNILDDEGLMPLYYTARWGRGPAMKALLRKNRSKINYVAREDNGWTALHVAAYYGHHEVVAILREAQAKLDIRDYEGCTPLLLATKRGHVEVMRKLLCELENVDSQSEAQDKDGDAPLMLAAANGLLAGVALLIEHGVDCNTRNEASWTPIIAASRWRNRGVVLALLEHKRTEFNAQDGTKQTALHKAASGGHIKILELLLRHGADFRIPDDRGRLALHLACSQGNVAAVKLLLYFTDNTQLEARGQDDMTPLHIAWQARDEDVERTPIEDLGPDDLTQSERSMPEFNFGRHMAVVEFLLSRGANLSANTNTEETILRLAIRNGEHEKLQHLVEYMVNDARAPFWSKLNTSGPSQAKKDYDALLTWAAGVFERHSIAKSLIEKRFNSSAIKYDSAIESAARAELPDVLWLLIANTPWDEKTLSTIESFNTPETPVNRSQQMVFEQGKDSDEIGSQMEDRLTVQDIIRSPPLGLLCNMHADSQDFALPTMEDESYSNSLRQFEAAVIQFYKGKSRFGSIRRYRNVQEVIYNKGPQNLVEAMMKGVKHHIEDLEPGFTWVHLPSTNVRLNCCIIERGDLTLTGIH